MTTRVTRSAIKRAPTTADRSDRTPPAKKPRSSNKATSTSEKQSIEAKHTDSQHFQSLKLTEETGDIFSTPASTLLVHSCNCQGSWGGGIAKAFKNHYPGAYKEYASHCDQHGDDLLQHAFLITPVDTDKQSHFIGCLFTSRCYGRNKDSPQQILEATGPAMEDLLRQVDEWNSRHDPAEYVGEVRMCKINSGLFAVPWEKTRKALEGIDVANHDIKAIKVVSLS